MLLFPKKVPTDPCPLSTCPKVNQCNFFVYDPEAFQTATSVLELRESKFVHKPFKCGVSISYSPSALLNVSPTDFQCRMLWGFSFWYRSIGLG